MVFEKYCTQDVCPRHILHKNCHFNYFLIFNIFYLSVITMYTNNILYLNITLNYHKNSQKTTIKQRIQFVTVFWKSIVFFVGLTYNTQMNIRAEATTANLMNSKVSIAIKVIVLCRHIFWHWCTWFTVTAVSAVCGLCSGTNSTTTLYCHAIYIGHCLRTDHGSWNTD